MIGKLSLYSFKKINLRYQSVLSHKCIISQTPITRNILIATIYRCLVQNLFLLMYSHDALVDHLVGEEHRELISVINRSVPAVIKLLDLHQEWFALFFTLGFIECFCKDTGHFNFCGFMQSCM